MSHAVVIGSGFGGLAAALRLRAKGFEVTVLEKQNQLGGKATTITSGDFTYDAGPTVITASFLIDELFSLFSKERAIELLPVTPWYRYSYSDGLFFDYGPSQEATKEAIASLFPSEVEGYEQFLAYSKKLFTVGYETYGVKPFDTFRCLLGSMKPLLSLHGFRSSHTMVSRFFKEEKLIRAFSVPPLLIGGNPFKTPAIYLLIHYLENQWGIHYPKGGTAALIKALVDLGKEQGIQFHTEKEVDRFIFSGKTIRSVFIKNEGELEADCFIFNGDPTTLYKNLIPKNKQSIWTKCRKRTYSPGMGLFVVYFSTSKRYKEVQHHTILLTNSFKEHIQGVFKTGSLPSDLNIYLHRPSATDPSMSPESFDSFYALVPVPNLHMQEINERHLSQKVLQQIEKSILPDLTKNLVDLVFKGPKEYQKEQNCYAGSPFTIQPTLLQSAYFRFGHKLQEAENGYLVGAGTHPGAGVPGALTSAKVLESYF